MSTPPSPPSPSLQSPFGGNNLAANIAWFEAKIEEREGQLIEVQKRLQAENSDLREGIEIMELLKTHQEEIMRLKSLLAACNHLLEKSAADFETPETSLASLHVMGIKYRDEKVRSTSPLRLGPCEFGVYERSDAVLEVAKHWQENSANRCSRQTMCGVISAIRSGKSTFLDLMASQKESGGDLFETKKRALLATQNEGLNEKFAKKLLSACSVAVTFSGKSRRDEDGELGEYEAIAWRVIWSHFCDPAVESWRDFAEKISQHPFNRFFPLGSALTAVRNDMMKIRAIEDCYLIFVVDNLFHSGAATQLLAHFGVAASSLPWMHLLYSSHNYDSMCNVKASRVMALTPLPFLSEMSRMKMLSGASTTPIDIGIVSELLQDSLGHPGLVVDLLHALSVSEEVENFRDAVLDRLAKLETSTHFLNSIKENQEEFSRALIMILSGELYSKTVLGSTISKGLLLQEAGMNGMAFLPPLVFKILHKRAGRGNDDFILEANSKQLLQLAHDFLSAVGKDPVTAATKRLLPLIRLRILLWRISAPKESSKVELLRILATLISRPLYIRFENQDRIALSFSAIKYPAVECFDIPVRHFRDDRELISGLSLAEASIWVPSCDQHPAAMYLQDCAGALVTFLHMGHPSNAPSRSDLINTVTVAEVLTKFYNSQHPIFSKTRAFVLFADHEGQKRDHGMAEEKLSYELRRKRYIQESDLRDKEVWVLRREEVFALIPDSFLERVK